VTLEMESESMGEL